MNALTHPFVGRGSTKPSGTTEHKQSCYDFAMTRIRLLHWRASEAGNYHQALGQAGYQVEYEEQFRPALMKSWRESPPDAFVIDLSRLPSHGREIAIALRQSPRTRQVPIVFCGGEPEKVQKIRSELPDACYCTPRTILTSLRKALRNRPVDPVKPTQMMDRYKSRTVAQKLGIRESSTVLALDAPRDLNQLLGELPPGVEIFEEEAPNDASVTLCFVQESHSLRPALSRVRGLAAKSKLWILWRKGGSAKRGELTEGALRETALDLGLVDYKICSVDAVWSAMLFARKRVV